MKKFLIGLAITMATPALALAAEPPAEPAGKTCCCCKEDKDEAGKMACCDKMKSEKDGAGSQSGHEGHDKH